jgi:hypothetical protein
MNCYILVWTLWFYFFLNEFNIDDIYPSKKDSDSGVGSDNGDKRLSATEVKLVIRSFLNKYWLLLAYYVSLLFWKHLKNRVPVFFSPTPHSLKCSFFFFSYYRIETRASHMLNKHSTSWAMPPVLFALVYFSDRVFPGQPWMAIFLLLSPD